jgi:FtsZ-interacting cell division protein ZipA
MEMSESTLILIIVGLAFVFFALWTFNAKQKRKFEDARRDRKRELEALKAKAAQKQTIQD